METGNGNFSEYAVDLGIVVPMIEFDDDLIQACREGDERAWQTITEKYGRLVFAIPLNYGLSKEDAADVTQITFMILFQSLEKFYKNARLAPWLTTVARRHSWRIIERRRREGVYSDGDLAENLPESLQLTIDMDTERWEWLEALHQALSRLDERCLHLLVLLYFDPDTPSYSEIAQRLDIALNSVSPIRARCLNRLRLLLDENPEPYT